MQWYLKVLNNYAGFEGRARRKEYWMFVLFNFIFELIVRIVDAILHTHSLLPFLYGLAVLIPSLAVSARRLHDTGKSGWVQLINLIPVIGTIIFIVFMCQDSQDRPNKYGPVPKEFYNE
ncbi:DUF805 domain-containing protein [Heyndrickxia acidicola]|uniref:DUF805 domain-containing protein n=1 Tax=Heyndrickxia acidicola TaxID=209389 RepID=A0ABU6MH73_9BACI|nr:DUF805 domain-containing protein [Heyndrickxia acidicola]MED1204026.1 DUF805 domain-containing protein [Heyndrickxia acidicola]